MVRRLHTTGYDLADHLLTLFVRCGYWPTPGMKILDYGCGEGQLVYRLRDLGFEAYGFDIHDRVIYRAAEDREFFSFAANPEKDTANTTIEDDRMQIPFSDNMFDMVISTSVIEHVIDLSSAMGEIARVIKSDGFSFHLYPSKSTLIEPHTFVPLGTTLQSWLWFYLWALLGVRNEFQSGMSAREVADINMKYSQTGIRYLSRRQLHKVCARYFENACFMDELMRMDFKSKWAGRLAAFRSDNRMKGLSVIQPSSALLTFNKRLVVDTSPEPALGKRVYHFLARRRLVHSLAQQPTIRFFKSRLGLHR